MDLINRYGIITGAGQGIGRALAVEFGSRGAHLLLVGRKESTLVATARLVEAAGGTAEVLTQDLTLPNSVERVSDAVESWATVDLLVNNAGNVRAGRLELTSEADIRSMIDLNLVAPVLLTRALLPRLRASAGQASADRASADRASIVLNISSGIALVGMPFYSVYAATKAGLARFGESLRRELTGLGVHVTTVYPGATDTDMMSSQNAGADLGWERRSLDDVIAEVLAGLEAGDHEINTAPADRRGMQELNISDPMAVDAAMAPGLADLESAVRDHRSI